MLTCVLRVLVSKPFLIFRWLSRLLRWKTIRTIPDARPFLTSSAEFRMLFSRLLLLLLHLLTFLFIASSALFISRSLSCFLHFLSTLFIWCAFTFLLEKGRKIKRITRVASNNSSVASQAGNVLAHRISYLSTGRLCWQPVLSFFSFITSPFSLSVCVRWKQNNSPLSSNNPTTHDVRHDQHITLDPTLIYFGKFTPSEHWKTTRI